MKELEDLKNNFHINWICQVHDGVETLHVCISSSEDEQNFR